MSKPKVNGLPTLVRRLLRRGGTLESTASAEEITPERVAGALTDRLRQRSIEAAELVAQETAESGFRALERVSGGVPVSNLTDAEYMSLEAIVQVVGRPAIRYTNGSIDMPESGLGENERWRVLVAIARSKINRVSASVGSISSGGVLYGTGWRLGEDLIVTNKHVLREIVENPNDSSTTWRLDQTKRPNVAFLPQRSSVEPIRFSILDAVFSAPNEDPDIAVLRFAIANDQPPPPLEIMFHAEAAGRYIGDDANAQFQGAVIYIVGHPFRALNSSASAAVFGTADGSKRCSPGEVVSIDETKCKLAHDCSTLGGNSGSCVFHARQHVVIGLHMGGLNVDEWTGRGTGNLALDFARLHSQPIRQILETGRA